MGILQGLHIVGRNARYFLDLVSYTDLRNLKEGSFFLYRVSDSGDIDFKLFDGAKREIMSGSEPIGNSIDDAVANLTKSNQSFMDYVTLSRELNAP